MAIAADSLRAVKSPFCLFAIKYAFEGNEFDMIFKKSAFLTRNMIKKAFFEQPFWILWKILAAKVPFI